MGGQRFLESFQIFHRHLSDPQVATKAVCHITTEITECTVVVPYSDQGLVTESVVRTLRNGQRLMPSRRQRRLSAEEHTPSSRAASSMGRWKNGDTSSSEAPPIFTIAMADCPEIRSESAYTSTGR